MAKKNEPNDEPTDPRDAAEAIGQQLYETLSKGFSEAFGFLQELSSTIEERIEEVFASPAKPNEPGAGKDVVDVSAKKTAPAKKKPAAKKTAPAKKKSAAKKKPVAKKKSAAKKKTASSPTRDELYTEAQRLDIAGRSTMSKAQLQRAIKAAKG